jgi:hypothetical protein
MTVQTLSNSFYIVSVANDYPTLSNFSLLSTSNKVDVLSDVLATIIIDEFSATHYSDLCDGEKSLVQESFNIELVTYGIKVDPELIAMCEACSSVLAALVIKYAQSVSTTDQINSELKIVKLSGQKFAINKSSYTMPKGFVLYHPVFGFLGFSDGISPYQPIGGKKALQSILEDGGFTSFEGMKWWKSMTV